MPDQNEEILAELADARAKSEEARAITGHTIELAAPERALSPLARLVLEHDEHLLEKFRFRTAQHGASPAAADYVLASYASNTYHLGERDLLHLLVGSHVRSGRTVGEECLRSITSTVAKVAGEDAAQYRGIASRLGRALSGETLEDLYAEVKPRDLLPRWFDDVGMADFFVAAGDQNLKWLEEERRWIVHDSGLWDTTSGAVTMETRWRGSISGAVAAVEYRTDLVTLDDGELKDGRDELRSELWKFFSNGKMAGGPLPRAQRDARMAVHAHEFDRDAHLLNVTNGVLDLSDASAPILHAHGADYRMRRRAGVAWSPESAPHPLWSFYLRVSFGADPAMHRLVRQLVGLASTGRVTEKLLVLLFSEHPDSGKSMFWTLLSRMLGTYAVTLAAKGLRDSKNDGASSHDGQLARVIGSRLVVVTELPTLMGGASADTLKRMTGKDTMTVRPPHGSAIEFLPEFLVGGASNHRPKLAPGEQALAERLLVVPALGPAKEMDPAWPTLTEAEREAVLRIYPDFRVGGGRDHVAAFKRARFEEQLCAPEVLESVLTDGVRGLADYQENGLARPDAVEEFRRQLAVRVRLGHAFVQEAVEDAAAEAFVTPEDLDRAFVAWCEERELEPNGEHLRAAMATRPGVRRGRSNNAVRWYGVQFREEAWTALGLGAVPRCRREPGKRSDLKRDPL